MVFILITTIMIIGILSSVSGHWEGTAVIALVGAIWVGRHWLFVTVPELEVGVIFRREGNTFARFVPAGRHRLLPFVERLVTTIPLNPGSISGTCNEVQTSGGVLLDVAWTLAYKLDPFRTAVVDRPRLARTLPHKSAAVARKHMDNVLRHVVGQYSVTQIAEPGFQTRLERELRLMLAQRLAPAGFIISRVMIGAIVLPPAMQSAFAAAHQRRLHTEVEAQALARLQRVISQFSDADMQRLMELERIHALGQNGVTLLYSTETAVNGRSTAPTNPNRPLIWPLVTDS